MAVLDQQTAPIENTQPGSQQAAASQNMMAEVMQSVPGLAKKIEAGNISDPGLKHDLALTFENIYQKSGGGAAGTAAEDTFQKGLNDQLKKDGSSLQINTEHSNGFVHFKQNAYAIVEDGKDGYRSSGMIVPEKADENYKSDLAANSKFEAPATTDAAPTSGDSTGLKGDSAATAPTSGDNKTADTSIPKDSDFSFSDPKTEQAYQHAAGDAAKVLTTPGLSDEQKKQGIIDAMNEVGVHDNLDLANFKGELSQKLGPDAHVSIRPSVAMQFHGGISVETADGKTLGLSVRQVNGKLVDSTQ